MNSIAFRFLMLSFVLLFFSFTNSETEGTVKWELDFETAKTTAASSDKIIMMSFQGSDWCAACKRLEKSLFQSESFQQYAEEHLVLLKVDFPMKKQNKLDDTQTAHNEALAEQYNKEGKFPRVLFFDAEGTLLGELNTTQPDVESYMKSIKEIVE